MPLEILPGIKSPADLKNLTFEELEKVVEEIREYTISTVTEIGGHLASTLGVVELTTALHYVFNTPEDKIIWDVGHQGYAHKILTGRFKKLKTIRQYKGLSGFLKRSESEYDVFGAGHASTSISAGLGVAAARDHLGKNFRVISVIGDGSMTGGLAFEGLNNAGQLRKQLLVILNDNDMSISPNVGAINIYLTKIVTNPMYNRIRDEVWKLTGSLPIGKTKARKYIKKIEESLKNLLVPGVIFDEMGFRYFGPIDGHDLDELVSTFKNISNITTPVLLHIVTKKGKGMQVAEDDPISYHGVKARSNASTKEDSNKVKQTVFQDVFGHLACEIANNRNDTVCITAAMKEGTGLVPFAKEFPDRFYDVGIAEGHGVTFAAGMATEGVRPIVAIYSTFLQRAFDHIVHDVSIQHLPVVFCMDRAGIAGEDGPTHHGALDIAYMRCIQDMIVTAPRNGNELRNILYTALNQSEHPFSIRYPKADAGDFDPNGQAELIPIGNWDVVKKGKDMAILAVGPQVEDALSVAAHFKDMGVSVEVVNCRFIKPMDEQYLKNILKKFKNIITVEEGVVTGGFGESVSHWLLLHGFTGNIKTLGLSDDFIEHGPRKVLLSDAGLDKIGIIKSADSMLIKHSAK